MASSDFYADGDQVRISEIVTDFSGAGTAEGRVLHMVIDSTGLARYCVEFPNGQWYYFTADELTAVDG